MSLTLPALVLYFLLAITPAYAGDPMRFYIETDLKERMFENVLSGGVTNIYADGNLVEGTTDAFLQFVRVNKIYSAKVILNSMGGSLGEGVRLGRAIRMFGFSTTIGTYEENRNPNSVRSSICVSACAYAFAGGRSRFYSQYTGRLGLHQFYFRSPNNSSIELTQQISGFLVSYLQEMGIDPIAFSVSTLADQNGIIWISPEQAIILGFANNGRQSPTAQIRLFGSSMTPYLRVEQEHEDSIARVLFLCDRVGRVLHMSFGMILGEENHSFVDRGWAKRNYIELDGDEILPLPNIEGVKTIEGAVWIDRNLTVQMVRRLIQSSRIGGWVDGFGAVRYGMTLDIPVVRKDLSQYAEQCLGR